MPKPVLGAIVFLIGVDLIDIAGLKRVWKAPAAASSTSRSSPRSWSSWWEWSRESSSPWCCRSSRWSVASTGHTVSSSASTPRASRPTRRRRTACRARRGCSSSATTRTSSTPTPTSSPTGSSSSSRPTPDPVRWLVLDCSSIPDVDYSAGAALHQLVDFVHNHGATLALAGLDPDLQATLEKFGVLQLLNVDHSIRRSRTPSSGFRSRPRDHSRAGRAGTAASLWEGVISDRLRRRRTRISAPRSGGRSAPSAGAGAAARRRRTGDPPADRADPVAVLEAQNLTREPDLVPVRHGRMMVSPFTFYRGSAAIMAADLADDAERRARRAAVRRCAPVQLRRLRIARAATAVRSERLRRDVARPVRVRRQAIGRQLRDRRRATTGSSPRNAARRPGRGESYRKAMA